MIVGFGFGFAWVGGFEFSGFVAALWVCWFTGFLSWVVQ